MKTGSHVRVAILILCAIALPAIARVVPSWFYKPGEITKRSDLVVVASPLASRVIGHPTNEIRAGFDERDRWGMRIDTNAVAPTETTFLVEETLKGAISTNTIVLFHYTWVKEAFERPDGWWCPPKLVGFTEHLKYRSGTCLVQFRHPKYLLFLNRMPDGRFRATTGQVDPTHSVHVLVQQEDLDSLAEDYLELKEESRKKTETATRPTVETASSNAVDATSARHSK